MNTFLIMEAMEAYAPACLAEEWDNIGLLLGDSKKKINKILVALDVTDEVVEEAILNKAELIIAHHPVIFKPLKRIVTTDGVSRRLIQLIKHDIAVFIAHTNLDKAENGTNDALFHILGLYNKKPLDEVSSLGCIGELPAAMPLKKLAELAKELLNSSYAHFVGYANQEISKVAICSGAGANSSVFKQAISKKCDVLITGDITYHKAQAALDEGLCIIDATHAATENIVTNSIAAYLKKQFPQLNIIVSTENTQIIHSL